MKKANPKTLFFFLFLIFICPAIWGQYTNQATDYWRTKNTGDWASTSIWESSPDGTTWYDVSNGLVPTSSATNIIIQHNITANASISVGVATINSACTLTMGTTTTLTLTVGKLLTVNGTLENKNPSATSIVNSSVSNVSFTAGSTYLLSAACTSTNGGLIPTGTYNLTSTVYISGVVSSGAIGGLSGLTVGNLTYNCPNQTAAYICGLGGWSQTIVNGTFNIISTGIGKISLTSTIFTVNNYNQTGGAVYICGSASSSGNRSLQVNGSFSIQGSSKFYFTNGSSSSASVKGYLLLFGNMSVTSTVAMAQNTGTVVGKHYSCIFFKGTENQVVNFAGTMTQTINDSISNSSGVTLNSNYLVSGRLSLMLGSLITSGNTLTYSGSTIYRTNGAIDASSGTINFSNTSAVALPASTFSGPVANLTLNGAGGITLGSNITISNVLTLTSGTLTTGANTLTISGSIARTNGTINTGTNGTLLFNGISEQNLTTDNLTSGAVNTLNVAAGSKLTTTGTISAGTLNLLSDATNGSATLLDNGTLTSTNTSVQQYMNAAYPRNWYMASPVASCIVPGSGYSFWQRDEASDSWSALSGGTQLLPGTGYILSPSISPATYTFSGGTINTGNIQTSLTYNNGVNKAGFNLIGNPYPSHITLNKTITDNAGCANTIWYRTVDSYDINNSKYVYSFRTCLMYADGSYLGSPEGTSPVVAPMQAFWLRTSSPSTLTFTNSMRSHQSNNPLKVPASSHSTQQVLRIQVTGTFSSDEAILYANNNASSNLDEYDAPKMCNNSACIPEIYTEISNEKLSINGMNTLPVNEEITLGFSTLTAGTFSIKAVASFNPTDNLKIILKDRQDSANPVLTDLTESTGYTFTSEAVTDNTSRFKLIIQSTTSPTGFSEKCISGILAYSKEHRIYIENNSDHSTCHVTIFNSIGQNTGTESLSGSNNFIHSTLTDGVYWILIKAGDKTGIYKTIVH